MPGETYSDARLNVTLGELRKVFMKQFAVEGPGDVEWLLFTFAPGRVNFIGEHVDYMGGWVCPAAVTEGTHILVARVKHLCKPTAAELRRLRFYATYNNEHFELDSLSPGAAGKTWTTFVRGAAAIRLAHCGVDLKAPQLDGVCMVVHGTLAMGAGMSASAAFGVALLHAIDSVVTQSYNKCPLTLGRRYAVLPKMPVDDLVLLAKQGRRIEVEHCGVNVGIMDQFISALAEPNKFLFLDCLDMKYEACELEPLLGGEYCWMLIDSMIKHDLLGDTANVYNSVRSDQENAQKKISEHMFGGTPFTFSELVREPARFTTLGPMALLDSCKGFLTTGEYERGKYQVMEQLRTLEFRKCTLASSNLTRDERVRRVGELLNEAHAGMRDLMKITTEELDFIQELINTDKDVAGGRMMGGGFGGCVILLLKRDAQERVVASVQDKFKARYGVVNTCYKVEQVGGGAFVVSLSSSSSL